jgi:hypothetical protein
VGAFRQHHVNFLRSPFLQACHHSGLFNDVMLDPAANVGLRYR